MPLSLQDLLALDVPAHLATIDPAGYPRITPIWFIFEDGAFYMSSLTGKRHLRDLARDARASIRVDAEEREAVDGVRANAQAGARGIVDLRRDGVAEWTRRITLKYVTGPSGLSRANMRAAQDRILIVLRPERIEYLST